MSSLSPCFCIALYGIVVSSPSFCVYITSFVTRYKDRGTVHQTVKRTGHAVMQEAHVPRVALETEQPPALWKGATMVFLKKLSAFVIVFAFLCAATTSCKPQVAVRLATTTSLEQSGLLGVLLDAFTKKTHVTVQVITTGSGAALELGKKGDVDLVIAHAPELEQMYKESGLVLARYSFLSSRFVLLGPLDDPAQVAQAATPEAALEKIAVYNTRLTQISGKPERTPVLFISRGDNSGTDIFEKSLWSKIGIKPDPAWYKEPGQGMSEALLLANSLGAYIIADLPTWLSVSNSAWFKQNYTNAIKILFDGSEEPENFSTIYSIIIFKSNSGSEQQKYARMVANFLLSQEAQTIISNFSIQGNKCYNIITQSTENQ